MSFVQNFPLFTIILSLVCAVISFAANDRWARGLTLFLLSASICMQAALLVFCAVNGTSYSYMMGHYPAPWGNEITVGVLESFMALLFAAVMLMSVLGGMPRIRRDIPEHRMRLYWVMIDLAHVALLALCYTNDIFTAYVFIEVLTIASCCLLAARDGGRPLLAAVRYMIFSLVGSGLFLIGVIFTYSITGQLLFPQLKESIALLWADGTYRFSMTVAIGLMVGGLAIKSGLFPFHFWMPDTYGRPRPPPPVSCRVWYPRGTSSCSSRSSIRSSASRSLRPVVFRTCCWCWASAAWWCAAFPPFRRGGCGP